MEWKVVRNIQKKKMKEKFNILIIIFSGFLNFLVSSTLPAAQQPQTPIKKTDQPPTSNILTSFNRQATVENDKHKQEEVISTAI